MPVVPLSLFDVSSVYAMMFTLIVGGPALLVCSLTIIFQNTVSRPLWIAWGLLVGVNIPGVVGFSHYLLMMPHSPFKGKGLSVTAPIVFGCYALQLILLYWLNRKKPRST